MTSEIGFDNEQYLDEQSRAIVERFDRIGGKLHLEFGGKIAFDFHAARVLPGYDPNVTIRVLQKLRELTEIIICIYAGAIERKKLRADFGVPYDVDAMKLIALAISAATNPAAKAAVDRLTHLRRCEFHTTHLPTAGDEAGLRRLGVNVTADPQFASHALVTG